MDIRKKAAPEVIGAGIAQQRHPGQRIKCFDQLRHDGIVAVVDGLKPPFLSGANVFKSSPNGMP